MLNKFSIFPFLYFLHQDGDIIFQSVAWSAALLDSGLMWLYWRKREISWALSKKILIKKNLIAVMQHSFSFLRLRDVTAKQSAHWGCAQQQPRWQQRKRKIFSSFTFCHIKNVFSSKSYDYLNGQFHSFIIHYLNMWQVFWAFMLLISTRSPLWCWVLAKLRSTNNQMIINQMSQFYLMN